jgi:endonuclease/exonuclease/phosphatase family metal-dependent hydrolase
MLLDQLEKYHVDITCVQEMRWIGTGTIEKKNWIIFYSCDNKEHKLGTGFVIHKRVKHLIMNFQPKSPRMCWLRIRGKFFNYSIINAHAPTEDKSDTEKDAFYDELRNLYDACPKHDVKLIIGDLNAQIGKEAIYYPTIGKEAYHQENNENGKRLIHMAASRNMVIGTTLFPHKDIHKITWRSPGAHHFSQIDHLLIDSRHVSHLMNARTHRCANVDSDHYLLVSRIRARISNAKKFYGKKVEKYDYERMTSLEKQAEYKINLKEHLQELAISSDDSLDSRWNKITGVIHKTAEETFGKASKKQSNDWFDKECREVTEVKNKAYVNMQQRSYTRASTEKYREARRKEKQVHKRKNKQYENEQVDRLEELGQQHQTRKFYRDINKVRKDFKPRLTVCKNKNGDIITEKGDILNR